MRGDEVCHVSFKAITQPHLIFSNQWENAHIGNSVLVTDNEELFTVTGQLRYIFGKQRKRRVCDDDISFIKHCYALTTAEITIS